MNRRQLLAFAVLLPLSRYLRLEAPRRTDFYEHVLREYFQPAVSAAREHCARTLKRAPVRPLTGGKTITFPVHARRN